jgi:hypothetical protein
MSLVVTAALFAIPQARPIAYPLILLSTVAHELGHGLTAIAVGGDFRQLQMFSDGSGVASWAGSGGRVQQALVAAGGLVGPAIAAAILLLVGSRPRGARLALGFVGGALLLTTVLLVRNPFGVAFIAGVGLLALAVAIRAPLAAAQATLVFVAVQLALACFSRSDYLFTAVAETSAGPMPSDVAQIAEALFLPYWFWGAVCAVVSLLALVGGMTGFMHATRSGPATTPSA